ncbi:MAG: hypothetical protein JXB23_05665 [Candidatus Aminicenantes bacterium]|nr:hypothetical protein [Candidatus Aminicenantes bacterium]
MYKQRWAPGTFYWKTWCFITVLVVLISIDCASVGEHKSSISQQVVSADDFFRQGKTFFEQFKNIEGKASFDQALSIDPGHKNSLYYRGKTFIKYLEIEPDHAYAHYELGLAYNQMRKKDLALIHLQ